jgi:hypothetical protein
MAQERGGSSAGEEHGQQKSRQRPPQLTAYETARWGAYHRCRVHALATAIISTISGQKATATARPRDEHRKIVDKRRRTAGSAAVLRPESKPGVPGRRSPDPAGRAPPKSPPGPKWVTRLVISARRSSGGSVSGTYGGVSCAVDQHRPGCPATVVRLRTPKTSGQLPSGPLPLEKACDPRLTRA